MGAPEKPKYPPLTDDEYAKTYETYVKNSTQKVLMLKQIKPVVEGFKGQEVKMLSIGPGDGYLEDNLINECGKSLHSNSVFSRGRHLGKIGNGVVPLVRVPFLALNIN